MGADWEGESVEQVQRPRCELFHGTFLCLQYYWSSPIIVYMLLPFDNKMLGVLKIMEW